MFRIIDWGWGGQTESITKDPTWKQISKQPPDGKRNELFKKIKPPNSFKESETSEICSNLPMYLPTPPCLVTKVALCRIPIHPVLRTLTCVYTLSYIHLLIKATLNIPSLSTKILLICQNTAEMPPLPQNLSLLSNKDNFYLAALTFYLYALYSNSYILSFHSCVCVCVSLLKSHKHLESIISL